MTQRLLAGFALAAMLGLGACAAFKPPPTEASIAGDRAVGTVTLHETTVAGFTEGSGTLRFQGEDHMFKMLGTVVGPGGASEVTASGEVYKLTKLSDFGGRYTQGDGPAGFDSSKKADLWLQNSAGVVMHLTGSSNGVTLSLGRDEIFVRLAQ